MTQPSPTRCSSDLADAEGGRPRPRDQADGVPCAPPASPPPCGGEARRAHTDARHHADHGEDMSESLLTRLQAANPEPLVVQTDSLDLFTDRKSTRPELQSLLRI